MSPVLRYQQSVAAVVATVVVAGMAATADAQDVAAGQAAAAVDPYVVGQPLPPSEPGSVLLSLTLEEAIEMALERNLDLKAARLTPQTPVRLTLVDGAGHAVERTISIDENYMVTLTDVVRNDSGASISVRPFGTVRRRGINSAIGVAISKIAIPRYT